MSRRQPIARQPVSISTQILLPRHCHRLAWCSSNCALRRFIVAMLASTLLGGCDRESKKVVSANSAASQSAGTAPSAANAALPEMAKLRALNAIARSPGDFPAVKAYVDLVLNENSPDELDRAMGVVEAAAYRVPPDQLESTVSLRNQLSERRAKLLSELANKRNTLDWEARVNELERVDLDADLENEDAFIGHLDELNDIKATLSGFSDQHSRELRARVQHSIDRYLNSQAAKHSLDYLELCRTRLHNEPDPLSERAASVASAAEAALAQLWGISEKDLTPRLQQAVNAQPDLLRAEIDRILVARCKEVLRQVKICADAALQEPPKDDDQTVGPLTKRLRWVQKQAQAAAQQESLLPSIPTMGQSNDMAETLDNIRHQSQRISQWFSFCQQAQYDAYQKWAVGVIKAAMAKHEAVYWTARGVNPVGDSNDVVATGIYKSTGFVEIDPNLLSSEVAAVYADVRGRLIGHMDAGTLVDLAAKTNESKRSLEGF
jgi:hypothetical protein